MRAPQRSVSTLAPPPSSTAARPIGPRSRISRERSASPSSGTATCGSARLRVHLLRIESLDEMLGLLAQLDPEEPFPLDALRRSPSKSGRPQVAQLPHGYLAARDDDLPPPAVDDVAGWDAALSGG